MRRALSLALAAVGLVGFGINAEAHALVRSSNPADGAILQQAPPAVSITFTERPDPTLSAIHLVDASGHSVDTSPARATADPLTLSVLTPSLPDGVYTVSWRTVSAVDGHVAAGAFSFGVAVATVPISTGAGATAPTTPPPSALGVAGRWILYAGFALLLGAAWVSLLAFRRSHSRLQVLAVAGGVVALIGFGLMVEAGRDAAGVSWSAYLRTSLGFGIGLQLAPIAAALLAAAGVLLVRTGERVLTAVVAALAMAAIFTHVLGSHAGSSSMPWLMVAVQWAHLAGFAVWIGGLAALLLGFGGVSTEDRVAAVRRFSFVAGFMLALVALTGLLRAVDEVGSWGRLVGTDFGRLVIAKVGLLGVLALLGALNRYRNVRRGAAGIPFLKQVSRGELAVAGVVLLAASLLTSLAPPSFVIASSRTAPPQISALGSDFGTTVRVKLTATPGFAGLNAFSLHVVDYDSGKPVVASSVSLRFQSPARPDLGSSTLALARQPSGDYFGRGTSLSLLGSWTVTAVIERGVDSVEVPLSLTTNALPEQITISRAAGQPTIYTIRLAAGRSVQVYLDPGSAGFNQIHATFFDAAGNELPIKDDFDVSGTLKGGTTTRFSATRFSSGHFVGQGQLPSGAWRFVFSATATDGAPLTAYVDQTIP